MLVGLGIVLMVAGAVLVWAVERQADGLDINSLGWILIAGGGLALIAGAIQASAYWSSRRTHSVTERHVSPDGEHYVEESHFD